MRLPDIFSRSKSPPSHPGFVPDVRYQTPETKISLESFFFSYFGVGILAGAAAAFGLIFLITGGHPDWRGLCATTGITAVFAFVLYRSFVARARKWTFFIYADRLRAVSSVRALDLLFDQITAAEMVSYSATRTGPWTFGSDFWRYCWKDFQVQFDVRFPKLGEAQTVSGLLTDIRLDPDAAPVVTSPELPARRPPIKEYPVTFGLSFVKISCTGLGFRRGFYLDVNDPRRFLDSLHLALDRYHKIRTALDSIPDASSAPVN